MHASQTTVIATPPSTTISSEWKRNNSGRRQAPVQCEETGLDRGEAVDDREDGNQRGVSGRVASRSDHRHELMQDPQHQQRQPADRQQMDRDQGRWGEQRHPRDSEPGRHDGLGQHKAAQRDREMQHGPA